MKILIIVLLMAGHAFGATILDSLKYSEKVAKEYSKGDSGHIGLYECQYNRIEELEVGGNLRIIECQGQTTVLVHGGYMTKVSFNCRMTFEPMPQGNGYQITYQSCR